MKRKKKLFIFLAIVLVGVVAFLWLNSSKAQVEMPSVSIANRDIKEEIYIPGNVYPVKEIELKSQLSGVLDKIFVKIGDVVQEGSPVASISLVPSTLELERLENNVKMAQINFDAAKLSYERSKKLYQAQTISQANMETAEREYGTAKEQLLSAQNQLAIQKTGKVIGKSETSNIVKSSISGTVIDLPLQEGASVIERNTLNSGITVAILAKMGEFVFRTQLAEQYLENIHLGDSISLAFNAYKDLKATAKITKISSKGTLENGIMKYTLEAEFPVNAQMPVIRSGYSATAEIILNSKKNVPSVEEKYIGYKNDSTYVWVKNGATLEKKYIELGISDGKYTEVTKGLTTNDKIVQNDSAQ